MSHDERPRENAAAESKGDLLVAARAHLKAGRKAQALSLLKSLVAREPENAAVFEELAVAAFSSARYPLAADSARRALALDPSLHRPHGVLAWIAVNQGLFDEAEGELRAQLEAVPAENLGLRAALHNQIGNLLFRQKRYAEAEASLHEATTLAPDRAAPLLNLAIVYRNAQKMKQAQASLEDLLALPDIPEAVAHKAHLNLGHVHASQGRYTAARRHFGQALILRKSLLGYLFWAVPWLARFQPFTLVLAFLIVLLVLWTWWWFFR